jgi:Icc-related predicted phosphoesterase
MTLLDIVADFGLSLAIGRKTTTPGAYLYVSEEGETCEGSGSLTARAPGIIRVVVISDTHEQHGTVDIPDGDILFVVGDILIFNRLLFSHDHSIAKIKKFNEWLGTLPHTEKVVVAGNHDHALEVMGKEMVQRLMTNATYLENETYHSDPLKLKIWGSPLSAANKGGRGANPAFQDLAELKAIAQTIPQDVDVVAIHGHPHTMPPIEDFLQNHSPSLCVFGHVHEAYGVHTIGTTRAINAALIGKGFQPVNPPVVHDLRLRSRV